MNIQYSYPFEIDKNGKVKRTNERKHIRDLIKQILFTRPGERVNRNSFGTGLAFLLGKSVDAELATTQQMLVQGQLQQWLGTRIIVKSVDAITKKNVFEIIVRYQIPDSSTIIPEHFSITSGIIPKFA